MIATHNIKVNGNWIRAGEEYGGHDVKEIPKEAPDAVKEAEAVPAAQDEKKAEAKPKTTTRRKATK